MGFLRVSSAIMYSLFVNIYFPAHQNTTLIYNQSLIFYLNSFTFSPLITGLPNGRQKDRTTWKISWHYSLPDNISSEDHYSDVQGHAAADDKPASATACHREQDNQQLNRK